MNRLSSIILITFVCLLIVMGISHSTAQNIDVEPSSVDDGFYGSPTDLKDSDSEADEVSARIEAKFRRVRNYRNRDRASALMLGWCAGCAR